DRLQLGEVAEDEQPFRAREAAEGNDLADLALDLEDDAGARCAHNRELGVEAVTLDDGFLLAYLRLREDGATRLALPFLRREQSRRAVRLRARGPRSRDPLLRSDRGEAGARLGERRARRAVVEPDEDVAGRDAISRGDADLLD